MYQSKGHRCLYILILLLAILLSGFHIASTSLSIQRLSTAINGLKTGKMPSTLPEQPKQLAISTSTK